MSDISAVPPELRQQAEKVPDLEAELAQQREHNLLRDLEMAGLRSGIDLASRQGKAWASTYEGDWNDSEAMKSDFDKMFPNAEAIQVEAPSNAEPVVEQADQFNTGMTDDRQRMGSVPGSTPVPTLEGDPYSEGFEAMQEAFKNGRPESNARAEVLNRVIDAAVDGDSRVLWTNAHREAWIEETGAKEHR